MAVIANLAAKLSVRTTGFEKGFRKAARVVGRFARRAAIAGTGLAFLAQRQIASIDAAVKHAQKLGLTTNELIALQHAAKLSGVAVRTFDMGLQRMTRRMAEASTGTGEAKDAIKELGLDAKKLAAQSPFFVLGKVADALENVESQAQRVRLGFKLFDSEAVAVINTLRGGSTTLFRSQREVELLGLTLSGEGVAGAVLFADSITRLKGAFTGLINTMIQGGLAERIATIADRITLFIVANRDNIIGLLKSAAAWAKNIIQVGAFIIIVPKVMAGIRSIVKGIQSIVKAKAILTALGGPVGIASVIGGLAVGGIAIAGIDKAFASIANAATTAAAGDNELADLMRETRDVIKEQATL